MSCNVFSEGWGWLPAAIFAVTVGAGFGGGDDAFAGERNRFLPDHVKCQFAGNVGMLSVGAGYSFAGGHLQSDLFYGYVPSSHAGTSIHHITWKNTFVPWERRLSSRWSYAPLALGAHLSCKVWNNNRETWATLPDRYPRRYYYPSATHLLLTVGGIAGYQHRPGHRFGVYVEAGAPVIYLEHSVREKRVEFHEIVSFDIGCIRMF